MTLVAYLYKRPRSPFHWVRYRDPATGKLRSESTGYRIGEPGQLQLANRRCAELALLELSAPKDVKHERWNEWARAYMESRYKGTGSLKNALRSLVDLFEFFKAHNVHSPRQFTYSIAAQFMDWRQSAKSLPKIKHNTARLRFIYIRVLMSEAVRRGYAPYNACREVKVPKGPTKRKLEITREDQTKIEKLLAKQKPWMREQWDVLMRQGMRISESPIPMTQIDTHKMNVHYRVKGGKIHSQELHPELLPLVKKARKEGRKRLVEPPPNPGPIWSLWFKKHGFPYSAHCTRVTVITRLLRAGHSPALVSLFIGHSEEVQVIYRRLNPPDARGLLASLSSAASSSSPA